MVSKKIVMVLLILGLLLIVGSVAIALSNNSHKVASDNINANAYSDVKPAVESGKVSIIINPPPK
jgi:hypothetical protein